MAAFHTFQCRPKQSKHDKKRYPHLCHWCGRINHGLLEGRGCCGSWATLSQLLEIWQSASNFGDQPWFPEQIPLHIECCVYKCLIFSRGIWMTLNRCRILWSQVLHNPNSLHGWSLSSTADSPSQHPSNSSRGNEEMMSPQPQVVSFTVSFRPAWSRVTRNIDKDISTSLSFETQLWEVSTAGSLVEIPSNASNRRAWCFTPTAGPWDDPPVPTLTQVSAIYTQVHICFKNRFLKNTEKNAVSFQNLKNPNLNRSLPL